jgi:hypothetical protein
VSTPAASSLRPLILGGALAAVIGAGALCVGALVDLRQALFSYLVAWAFGLTIAIGALAFSMTAYVTHAKWLVAIRRLIEAIVVTVPLFAVLFLPIAFFARQIYLWAAPASTWTPFVAEQLRKKHAYLNLPFWYGRAAVFFAVWSTIALLLRRWSLRADRDADPELTAKRRALSGAMAPVLALTFTFGAFDWMMSLDPTWTSNVYGFYLFSAGFLGASAVIAIVAYAAWRAALIPKEVSAPHFNAIGNVMLAMTVFWAYIAFVQMMLIWIADLPEEVTWYATRSHGSWGAVCWYLGVAHFLLPFLALLVRSWKREPKVLAAIGVWLVVAHFVDMHWLIMPTLHPEGVRPHWLDLAAVVAVAGAAVSFGAWRFRSAPAFPERDAELPDSLGFEMT